jgi:hypoxanthine-DNA glycosylase
LANSEAKPALKRSFAPFADERTTLLILGSLPGEASLKAQRYYANPQNLFWRLLGGALGEDLAAMDYEARLATLIRRGIGVWDVTAEAERQGSLDAAIRNARDNDLEGLINLLPSLQAIGFNGVRAARIGRRLVAGVTRPIELIDLPSSSPAYASMPYSVKAAGWGVLGAFAAP